MNRNSEKRSKTSKSTLYYHEQKKLKIYSELYPNDILLRNFKESPVQEVKSTTEESSSGSELEERSSDNDEDFAEGSSDDMSSTEDFSEFTSYSDKEYRSAEVQKQGNQLYDAEKTDKKYPKNTRNLNHIDNNTKPFLNCSMTKYLHAPIWNEEFTKKDFMLERMANSLRSRETYESLLNSFRDFNKMVINGDLPNHKPSLWRMLGRNDSCIIKHKYCCRCLLYFGTEKSPRPQPNNCSNSEEKNHKFSYFMQVNLKPQLIDLFSLPGITNLLSYRFKRPQSNAIRDIYDGEEYKKLCLPGNFLHNPNNFSFTFNTDGVSMGDSTKDSAWPIWVQLNELPPHSRHKHMMLAGFWIDIEKPIFTDFLLPFAIEMRDLYENGIFWRPNEEEKIQSKFIAPICTVDSVARWEILNMTQYNGSHGCTYCYHSGVQDSSRRLYVTEKTTNKNLRTHDDIVSDGNKAYETQTVIRGVKGPSALALLPLLKLDKGFPVDSLHAEWIGAGKRHNKHNFFSSLGNWFIKNKKWTKLTDVYDSIDEILTEIKPPTRISRKPRTITQMNLWTGSEWRNWILFYSLPCLKNILKPEFFEHYALLVNACYLLNTDSITENDLRTAKQQLQKYDKDSVDLWGKESMCYNLHLVTHHAVDSVRSWGPSWAHSTFSFESWNGDVIKTITSPHCRDSQVISRFLMRKTLLHASSDDTVHELVRKRITQLLNGAKSFSDKPKFIGKAILNETSPAELSALRTSGFECTQYKSFKKITLNGVEYQQRDNKIRKTCNSLLYSKSIGFAEIVKFVFFQHEEQEITGLFVSQLKKIKTVFSTSHIWQVSPRKTLLFLPIDDIEGPVIKCQVGTIIYAMKLPNYWDSD